MSGLAQPNDGAASKGGQAPLIEEFGIRGLYGYRTIALSTHHAATILIARNGTGKTTLLGVLNAFLKGEFSRLRDLEFEAVFCKFKDLSEYFILKKSDIIELFSSPEVSELISVSSKINVSTSVLFKFVTEDWEAIQDSDIRYENAVFTALTKIYGYNITRISKVISDLNNAIYDRNPNVAAIISATKMATRGCEVLYLPTYRRVELALRDDAKTPPHRRKRPKFAFDTGSLFTGDIQFGLGDIADRLNEMNERIAFQSNNEYRKISANIISDLIGGAFESHDISTSRIPSKSDLDLLFSRVEQSRRQGPYYPVSIPNLDKLYSLDGVPEFSQKFLSYFLNQLDQVIETTREVEMRVQEFVDICNRYLASDEVLTDLNLDQFDRQVDGKRLVLNKTNLQVTVVSLPENRRISLDALSSGEKQMISLFAKLFLYESPKIILIDEPELSLSIDWQRHILVDVVNSPLCRQLVAITHSPFVFDNELEPFAGSLHVSAERQEMLPFEDDFQSEDDAFEQ